jgi:hypothetical protein
MKNKGFERNFIKSPDSRKRQPEREYIESLQPKPRKLPFRGDFQRRLVRSPCVIGRWCILRRPRGRRILPENLEVVESGHPRLISDAEKSEIARIRARLSSLNAERAALEERLAAFQHQHEMPLDSCDPRARSGDPPVVTSSSTTAEIRRKLDFAECGYGMPVFF